MNSDMIQPPTPENGPHPDDIQWDTSGLVAGVVQDDRDGRVLMLGWLDAEALAATLRTGEVHFHSRSRRRLWRKGETSGNVLRLRSLAVDCDGDALLIGVEPVGPTCHRGTRSCFDPEDAPFRAPSNVPAGVHPEGAGPGDATAADDAGAGAPGQPDRPPSVAPADAQGFTWLEQLWATIRDRQEHRPEGSHTARLLAGGVDLVGRKVVEEATEVLIAAKNHDAAQASGADRTPHEEALAGEAADLVYHALVLLADRDLEPASVMGVLRRRHRDPV